MCALAQVSDANGVGRGDRSKFTRAELDSHANMVVLGKHCTVIRRTGHTVNVNAFASEVGSLKQVPIVDAAVVYEDRMNDEKYIMIMYNALYIRVLSV